MISDRYENLIAEGADLALRLGEQAEFEFRNPELGSARRLFVSSPSYLARRPAPTRLTDLADHDLIAGPSNPGGGSWVARRGATTETQSVNPRIRTGWGPGWSGCDCGLGIAISSIWMCGGGACLRRAGRAFGRVSPRSHRRVRRVPRRPPPLAKGARLGRNYSSERSQAWRTRNRREAASRNNGAATVE